MKEVKLQKYPAYKDSGVEWLGEIPEHWEVKKITHIFNTIGSGTTPTAGTAKYYDDGIINFLQTGDLTDGLIRATSKRITTKAISDFSSLKIYPKESLVVAMYGATIGKVGYLDIESTTNQACCVLGVPNDFFTKYGFYWFIGAKSTIISMSYGGGQPNISQDLIKSLRVSVPPIEEQIAIANFLDNKTALIDKAIALKEKQIELLKERRQILIHRAVTRGLNPDVKLKDSGVEWIGEIPEHWEVKALKFIADLQSGETISPDKFTDEEGYPVYGGNGFRGYTSTYTNEGEYALIGRQGALCGNVNYAKGKFYASEHAIVVYPLHNENVLWLGEAIKQANFNRLSQSAAQPGIAVSVVKNVLFPYPPISEQYEISNYLNSISFKISTAITLKEKEIEKLKEYKNVLINEAVSGKIKVG